MLAQPREFNFDAGSASVDRPPWGFFRNATEVVLGQGPACWQAAVAAMGAWRMGQLGWCDFLAPTPPAVGQVVVARARHFGFWSLHPSRIVEVDRGERTFRFMIRTLEGHEECGEERFALEWRVNGEVWFGIHSYSRPARWTGWLGLPYVRCLQARFGREAAEAMQRLSA